MEPIEFADKYLKPYEKKGVEIIPDLCPYCDGGSKGDKKTFALNREKETFNCKRGKCGKSGTFWKLLNDFGEIRQKRTWKKPTRKISKPNDKLKDYMKTRCISEETWKNNNVALFHDDKKNKDFIAFVYKENQEEVMRKYRSIGKDKIMYSSEDTKAVFWGIDECEADKPLTICEGEFDRLALRESGVNNVVSLHSGTNNLKCLDNCWEWLERFDEIILWMDDDEAGEKAEDVLVNRLGEWRCRIVENNLKGNDPNEVLYLHGKEQVKQLVESAKEIDLPGILLMDEVEEFKLTEDKRYLSGFDILDEEMGGFLFGETTLWTGKNGNGKSTVVGQELIEAVDQGYPVFAYSGEMNPSIVKHWLELQMAGYDNLKQDPSTQELYVSESVLSKIRQWYRDKFYIYDIKQGNNASKVLKYMTYSVRRYGVRVIMIDSVMATYMDFNRGEKKWDKEAEFMLKLKNFAQKFDVHIHIIAHPIKTDGKVQKEHIRGRGDITDLAHNIIRVSRENEGPEMKVLKNRIFGADTKMFLNYDRYSHRVYQNSEAERVYGWQEDRQENINF